MNRMPAASTAGDKAAALVTPIGFVNAWHRSSALLQVDHLGTDSLVGYVQATLDETCKGSLLATGHTMQLYPSSRPSSGNAGN